MLSGEDSVGRIPSSYFLAADRECGTQGGGSGADWAASTVAAWPAFGCWGAAGIRCQAPTEQGALLHCNPEQG